MNKSNDIIWGLTNQVFLTLLLSSPILWLYININDGKLDVLKYNIPVAIISLIILIVTWIIFIRSHTFKGRNIILAIFNVFSIIIIAIVAIVAVIFIYIGITWMQEKLFVSNNYIFYQFNWPNSYLIFLFEFEILAICIYFLFKSKINNEIQWVADLVRGIKKHWIITIVINVVVLYFTITSVTVVNYDKITKHTWHNPKGIEYMYSEIKSVDTGFKGNIIGSAGKKRGDFYYDITFKNGKSLSFNAAITDKYDVTYTEYEVFDDLVMKGNVTKTGSTENSKYSYLDQQYIEILCRVIENKVSTS